MILFLFLRYWTEEHEIYLKYMHTVPYNSAHRGNEKVRMSCFKKQWEREGKFKKILELKHEGHVIGFGKGKSRG